ncbi:uncharacterized protein STEHIDRAFT_63096 [Stereum hirsutum FP-91666 SS1]|uniref:uncharacterized protein n=1 Tax=Stereum hirsutum (strain FP-91666) TaxID=721885 RepID=UPI000444958E|nr:uncharacterized protein STEHIDRAFT_63096 [Stereum hirsutum FP-91666 SS1]EIM83566.1 hypothetical protein STEHIDRAFT_63096 [Stereum hirsutum FP-91666 SS1]
MGRWTQYDEDEARLPEGMTRVGYDSDTGKYYFRDSDGSLWEGPEGAQYGEMVKVSDAPIALGESSNGNDVEPGGRADGYSPLAVDPVSLFNGTRIRSESPYRMLFPFLLIIIVILLLIGRLVVFPSSSSSTPAKLCPSGSTASVIVKGDTCWAIAKSHESSVDDLLSLNPGLDCDTLKPGQRICVRSESSTSGARRG